MYFIHHFTRVQRETSNHNFEKFMRCKIVMYIRSCWVKINSSFKPWLKSFLRDHQGFICMCQIDLRFNIFELSARIQYYEYFLLALGYASQLMQARQHTPFANRSAIPCIKIYFSRWILGILPRNEVLSMTFTLPKIIFKLNHWCHSK